MGTPVPLRLDDQLCFALHATSRAMTRAYAPMLDPLGLTYPQYIVLLVLWEQDALTVSEIGARLSLDSGTLTPLLRRMDRNGLLVRVRSTSDERRVEVRLSADGKKLSKKAPEIRACVLARTGLTEETGGALLRQLQQLFAALASTDSIPNGIQGRKKRLTR